MATSESDLCFVWNSTWTLTAISRMQAGRRAARQRGFLCANWVSFLPLFGRRPFCCVTNFWPRVWVWVCEAALVQWIYGALFRARRFSTPLPLWSAAAVLGILRHNLLNIQSRDLIFVRSCERLIHDPSCLALSGCSLTKFAIFNSHPCI